jgi:5-methylcytosine-specific restriction endonuclease McrBC regulatory subunit McrC
MSAQSKQPPAKLNFKEPKMFEFMTRLSPDPEAMRSRQLLTAKLELLEAQQALENAEFLAVEKAAYVEMLEKRVNRLER